MTGGVLKIPSSFTYKGQLWTIEIESNLHHEDGTKCDGLCDTSARKIYLESKIPKKRRIGALFHELFHVVVHEAHIPAKALLTEDIEDILAEAFAALLLSCFEVKWKK